MRPRRCRTGWCPRHHFLEDWGDARAIDGTVTILQPLILPLYSGQSRAELLDAMLRQPPRAAYDIVRSYWQGKAVRRTSKRRGGSRSVRAWLPIRPCRRSRRRSQTHLPRPPQLPPATGSTCSSGPIRILLDGRYANNAWLQELPKPITKLMWDNAIHLSPRTAKRLELDNQHHVELKYRGRSVTWLGLDLSRAGG